MQFDSNDINEKALYVLKINDNGRFETEYWSINKELSPPVNSDNFYELIRFKKDTDKEAEQMLLLKKKKIDDFYKSLYDSHPLLFGFRDYCPKYTLRSSYMNFVGVHSPDEINIQISDDRKNMYFHNPRSPIGSAGYDYTSIIEYTKDFFDAYFIEEAYKKCRQNNSIKAFSNRKHGWTFYNYNLNEILSVEISTNFGYGSSSYFTTTLIYDGIKIIPFSRLVLYRIANTMELIRHTREYSVNDSSWGLALDFIKDACNDYVDNGADSFIGNYVINECETLIKLLPEYLETNIFNLSENTDGTYYYKEDKVRKVELNGYELYVFRGEKIAGATDFTQSIKKLDKITPTLSYVDCINNCCQQVLPQLTTALFELKEYMTYLSQELDEKKKYLSAKLDEKEKLQPTIENFKGEDIKIRNIIHENCDKKKYSYYSSHVSELVKNELTQKFSNYSTIIEKYVSLKHEIDFNKKNIEALGDSIRKHYMYEVQIRMSKDKIAEYIEHLES